MSLIKPSINTKSSVYTYTFTASQSSVEVDVTVAVPAGSKAIAGGFSVYSVTREIYIDPGPLRVFAPVDVGWRLAMVLNGLDGETIQVTGYASYVS